MIVSSLASALLTILMTIINFSSLILVNHVTKAYPDSNCNDSID